MISLTTMTATSALSFVGRDGEAAAHVPHATADRPMHARPGRGFRVASVVCAAVIAGSLLSAVVLGMSATGAPHEASTVAAPAENATDANANTRG